MRGVCPQKVLSDVQAFTPARTFVNPALQQAAGRYQPLYGVDGNAEAHKEISAIFTEIVLKNNSIDGIFYPSIKNDEICYNVALIPESIKKLSLLVVMECSVYKNKDIIEFCEDAIAPVNEFGEILWNES